MSTTLFGLREFGDAGAFLTGARIPITHVWGNPFKSVAWIADHFVIENDRRIWRDKIRSETIEMLAIDVADPDVARWCNRQIATSLGLPNPEHAVLSYGNEWCFWILADECPRFIGDLRTGLASVVRDIPCADVNIPLARAALLRALFGVSNA